jgi:hypothetical protein
MYVNKSVCVCAGTIFFFLSLSYSFTSNRTELVVDDNKIPVRTADGRLLFWFNSNTSSTQRAISQPF